MGISILPLSESVDGKPILLDQTIAANQVLLHTAVASGIDSITIWATNTSADEALLTVAIGDTAVPGELVANAVPIAPFETKKIIMAGDPITNSVLIQAFANVVNVINITGEIIRRV